VSFTVIDAPQRSEAWFQVRAGRLTGSCACDMLATIKSGEAAARRDLRLRLVCERLTGLPQEDCFVNAAMQRGIDKEADAIAAYEALTGNLLLTSGFLLHDELMAGCSLDGHVDNFAGIVEVKAPKSATHLRYLRDGRAPAEHLPQITHNLWISGAAWCDFLSWDDRFPPPLQTMLVRVERDDVDIVGYARKAVAFLEEVDREYAAVQGWRVLEVAS
jgi:hypothetical protein